jgi:membrane protein DedA with SNARE-associated domain
MAPNKSHSPSWRSARLIPAFLLVTAPIIAALYLPAPAYIAGLGYVGVFFAALIGTATIFFPVPHAAVVFLAGMKLNLVFVIFAGTLGSSLGELTGYYAATTVVPESRLLHFFHSLRKRAHGHDFLAILIFAAIPLPIFDVAGITAGAIDYPARLFFVACVIGKFIRTTVTALLGRYGAHALAGGAL